jgi:DNA repair exonuclease SbcCD ATPase subunit
MKQPNSQRAIIIQASIPKYFRDLLNNLFELEKKTVGAIDAQQLQQEIEQQIKKLNNKKQALEKIKLSSKKKSKRRNKLSNKIKNNEQSINAKQQQLNSIEATKRIITKMKDCFYIKDDISGNNVHYYYENPINESYNDTRTDVDAHISGIKTDNLVIIDVIKPIIRSQTNDKSAIVQKGIVTVTSKDLNKEANHEKND